MRVRRKAYLKIYKNRHTLHKPQSTASNRTCGVFCITVKSIVSFVYLLVALTEKKVNADGIEQYDNT